MMSMPEQQQSRCASSVQGLLHYFGTCLCMLSCGIQTGPCLLNDRKLPNASMFLVMIHLDMRGAACKKWASIQSMPILI